MSIQASDKITLKFAWEGPTTKKHPPMQIDKIHLWLNGSMQDIHIRLSKETATLKRVFLPFVILNYRPLDYQHKNSLEVSIEKIKTLVLQAGRLGGQNVPLEIPETLEIGQTYCLVVSSNNLFPTAKLIKEKSTSVQEEEGKTGLSRNKELLYQYAEGTLLTSLDESVKAIIPKLMGVTMKTLKEGQYPNAHEMKKIIHKLPSDKVFQIIKKLRKMHKGKLSREIVLQKTMDLQGEFLALLGFKTFENFIHKTFLLYLEEPISEFAKIFFLTIAEGTAIRFFEMFNLPLPSQTETVPASQTQLQELVSRKLEEL